MASQAFIFLRHRPWGSLTGRHWIDSFSSPRPAPSYRHRYHRHHQNLKCGGSNDNFTEFSKSPLMWEQWTARSVPSQHGCWPSVDRDWQLSERINTRQAGGALAAISGKELLHEGTWGDEGGRQDRSWRGIKKKGFLNGQFANICIIFNLKCSIIGSKLMATKLNWTYGIFMAFTVYLAHSLWIMLT